MPRSPLLQSMTLIELRPLVPVALMILLVACQQQLPQPEPTVTIAASPTAVVSPSATSVEPSPTATQNARQEVLPTPTLIPTSTAIPPEPTATVPPAPHVNVDVVPYEESECSDKYPCNDDVDAWESRMRVPPEFEINYFARVDGKLTAITFGPDDLLYAAVVTGTLYTVDSEGQATPFFSGLLTPTGLAFLPGSDRLYVSSRVDPAVVNGEGQISLIQDGEMTQLVGGLPCCFVGMHGPNGIAFGPDGYGYVGVGGRADHGEVLEGPKRDKLDDLDPLEASILRFDPHNGALEVYATGFRNPYDIAWDAEGDLYATDNGRDGNQAEGDNPPDELHLVVPGGQHGYPWYDCPVCFSAPEGVSVIPPLYEFLPHSAATGIVAYKHHAFPGYYNNLFAALWSAFPGAQKVVRFGPGGQRASDFATGFSSPIDLTVGPDGSLYVADFHTGIIFKISYAG